MRRALLCAVLLGGCFVEAPPLPANYTDPGQRSHAFVTVEKDHDADYSADPPSAEQRERAASFAQHIDEATTAVAQGQGGHHGAPYKSFQQAADCSVLESTATTARAACGGQLMVDRCGSGPVLGTYYPTECSACADMEAAQAALSAAGCGTLVLYPPVRQ